MTQLGVRLLSVALVAIVSLMPMPSRAIDFVTGDVIVGVSNGTYLHYDRQGNKLSDAFDDGLAGYTTGCAFDQSGDLYTTDFNATKVVTYTQLLPRLTQVIDTGTISPLGHSESIVFDRDGNFYVGNADGNHLIQKYSKGGNFLKSFIVPTENRGTDWIELSSDQHTIFYTSEGRRIMRAYLPSLPGIPAVPMLDFANLPNDGGTAYALRLLPPGDGNGGLLVADWTDIKRLDKNGAVIQTYDAPGEDSWFSMNLDPSGRSFWAGGIYSGNLYKFNIATGAVEVGPIHVSSQIDGVCVFSEPTAALTQIVDPIPFGEGTSSRDSLLVRSNITTNPDDLASNGRPVRGVAADGVARVLIRVPAHAGDSFTFTVINDHGTNGQGTESTSVDEDGGLSDPITSPGATSFSASITVQTQSTSKGPMAFAVYRAPADFVRSWSVTDSNSKSRTVTIDITSQGSPGISSFPITIVRPPVVFIHGLWGDARGWKTFTPLINDNQQFAIFKVDYSSKVDVSATNPSYYSLAAGVRSNSLGFGYNAPEVLRQIKGDIHRFRDSQNPLLLKVAAVRADLVAHSMGGDIARTLPLVPGFADRTFGRGIIHKLITIGTPHLGTPLAGQLLNVANACVAIVIGDGIQGFSGDQYAFTNVTTTSGKTVDGAVYDLMGDLTQSAAGLSGALKKLNVQTQYPIATAMVVGKMSSAQLRSLDASSCAWWNLLCKAQAVPGVVTRLLIRHFCVGDPLADNLTTSGWPTILGAESDGIVPINSQADGFSVSPAISLLSPTTLVYGVIHTSTIEELGFSGPGELQGNDQGTAVPGIVMRLLNSPVTSARYTCLPQGASNNCK